MKSVLLPLSAMLLASAMVIAPASAEEARIDIVISPSTVNLDMKGVWVTVHADIPYSLVDHDVLVTLNAVPVKSTFADNRGDLVAKFPVGDVAAILTEYVGEEVELTLSGTAADGTEFYGTDTIRVIQSSKK
ncbi:MAG: hypothetical protein PHO07_07290 [Pirellulales bacterium]|jgi:hypothetical protein|nr:hypothetical protein [Thermoguttaceae bacterium]MDD4786957.1 hypothetical protein [Pirellulales bacterium]MDI9444336.1 hypothetical protein [Planctomycetota bacterium]NLZ01966.1 hypothetical protein [Pirellulaceae bacterium]